MNEVRICKNCGAYFTADESDKTLVLCEKCLHSLSKQLLDLIYAYFGLMK